MNPAEFCHKIAYYIKEDIPFFFLVDFEKQKPMVVPLSHCDSEGIQFQLSSENATTTSGNIALKINTEAYDSYEKAFNYVKNSIHHGDSFLVNLTYPTPISTTSSLQSIYTHAHALYKLYYKDQFVVFSPESFIQIRQNKIRTFPMKGTIMADLPHAASLLLNNNKEQWEHNTIVDLMRNDLSMIATDVEVLRFRFISEIISPQGKMLQTSSEICGHLKEHWQKNFGELLLRLLPAGSISGAPKDKTIEIIKEAEPDQRGYYTGVFGTYIRGEVDSAVAIRYIEKNEKEQLIYRSGGGITFMSDVKEEYQELLNKIYVPTRNTSLS